MVELSEARKPNVVAPSSWVVVVVVVVLLLSGDCRGRYPYEQCVVTKGCFHSEVPVESLAVDAMRTGQFRPLDRSHLPTRGVSSPMLTLRDLSGVVA
ncbi:hypothetical protein B0T26DRAFT_691435 [Lasiosphaeria miniovina]|uniref:Uncharacterized protein n=1 Tax=Lasiosphaeria miniovina TaxID=1954250 RepID=A0AA40B2Y9_9PEZI|nr:uncharacterized protein B0T26DRAFT_691435 [Lasiosphaeria miniovina]KAK0726691.1 hypothetical protein B0T26DRAFT_691435 [Lasiosphaeria miniovina]